ncbi:Universal stress protein UspA-like protein [Paraburkholderia piptadeniae]|uniref:Universal stress protein UspA-like protein n=1 Tax=Paraburkholderia piptadeniae TaxID=1701573 RepID=A0A1N7RU18_9BURK|nr:universal stress protein [Paraburkholderia piptadeniae]SIT38605.1 Universal stress protein UspA-like protein [Paraburkholderia piptadeniae]
MLKLLIPVLCEAGALEAARHAVFLFAEKCVAQVELIEVLDEVGEGRTVAFQSRAALRRREKLSMRDALARTCAILDDAGVPYTWKRIFGPPEKSIATYAARDGADVVVLDASGLGFFRKWGMLARLWRLSPKPITMLH